MVSLKTVVLLLIRNNDGGRQLLHNRPVGALLSQVLRGPQDILL